MERFGFTGPQVQKLTREFAGNRESVFRKAVAEKQFSYNLTQAPAFFNSGLSRLFLQFQKWGAQRQRDLARNVFRPMFGGEMVNGVRTGNPAPFLRFVLGTFGQTATVAWLAQSLFGRERKDPSWDEIWNTATDNEKRAMQLSVYRIMRDLTMTGGMGLLGDYGRNLLDTITPGRSKDLVSPPGIQIAKDLIQIVKPPSRRTRRPLTDNKRR